MIFHDLTLEGVGPYANRQTLSFGYDERKPVTLVGGVNGAGKTTLIRSLFHVLYGARSLAELGQRASTSYKTFLAESIHHGCKRASLELTLTVPGLRDGARLMVRRQWRRTGRGISEDLDIFVDDTYDEELSESWDETIEQIAPLGVARLFFFDGEKIEALADLDAAAKSLRTAIGSLLGLDLVDQLRTDLVAVQRRASRDIGSPASARLEERQTKLAAARELCDEIRDRVERLQQEHAVTKEEHARARDALHVVGGDLVERRDELEREADAARDAEEAVWCEAREAAADPLGPLTLVPDLLRAVTDTARDRQLRDEHERFQVLLADRDAWIVAELEKRDGATAKEITRLLEEERKARTQSARDGTPFAPRTSAVALTELSDERLTSWRAAALRLMDRLDQAVESSDESERRVSRIPDNDSVKILLAAVAESKARVRAAQAELEEAEALLGSAEGQVERALASRDAELTRLAEAQDGEERQRRVIHHAELARETLVALRRRIAERHVERIAAYAVGCLELLLRKERLIQGLEIDPETFVLTLRGAHGRELRPEALSAGERQLTALSLLWALARAAGRPLPVVIDTPLGRLDADHRRHVVERYMPAASHQVVVLSTDTEIDTGLYGLLAPAIAVERRLAIDEDGRTTIADGYLELSPA